MSGIKTLLKTAHDKAKLILSTITIIIAIITGAWSIITDVFIPRSEAEEYYKRLDIETSYNKAFRLEQRIERLDRITSGRELSEEEKKAYKRYIRQLDEVDEHIYNLETRIFSEEK